MFEKKYIVRISIALVALSLLCACSKQPAFNGSMVGDSNHFDLDFDVLNTSYTHQLEMIEGEALDVVVESESGKVSLVIQKDNEEPIYQGSKITAKEFRVGIQSEGTYTMTVTGKKARGHVAIARVKAD